MRAADKKVNNRIKVRLAQDLRDIVLVQVLDSYANNDTTARKTLPCVGVEYFDA
jgi:hypothetical protein